MVNQVYLVRIMFLVEMIASMRLLLDVTASLVSRVKEAKPVLLDPLVSLVTTTLLRVKPDCLVKLERQETKVNVV